MFFFNDTATTEIYTLSLHDALPICTNQRVTPGETGPTSGTVRLELQADCFAGAWANHAETVPDESGQPLIAEITQDDVDRALDAAARIGDDFIQQNLGGGTVDQDAFTPGSSEQRQRRFTAGYEDRKSVV